MPVWNKSSIPAEFSRFRAVNHNFNGLWTRPSGWERGRASLCIFHGYAIRKALSPQFPIITALCTTPLRGCEENIDVRTKNGINISNRQKIGFIIPFSDVRRLRRAFGFASGWERRRRTPRRRKTMKKFIIGAAMSVLLGTAAHAETVGVSMALFDDNFLTVLRNGMQDYSKELKGVTLQVEDAQNDVAKQQSQIQNFIASKVDAIIVNPVDTDATAAMSKLAADAKIPLVYVNRQPVNVDSLPDGQAFVASDETVAGTLEAKEVCRLLGGKGNAVIMMGELSNQAARMRTQSAKDVLKTDECKGISVVEEQTANWQRTQGSDLVTNWLSSGIEFNAVIANNDEMAIGAIQSLKAAGKDMKDYVVAGVDATQDALAAMQAGDLDATVFQDAAGQGKGALDAALKLVKGEKVEKKVYIPFQLVTPENVKDYVAKN